MPGLAPGGRSGTVVSVPTTAPISGDSSRRFARSVKPGPVDTAAGTSAGATDAAAAAMSALTLVGVDVRLLTSHSPSRSATCSRVLRDRSRAPPENRTITEQINYWARISMQVERSGSVATRRVLAVAAGDAQFSSLDADERAAAHALVDARIGERATAERFGRAARAAGQTTVSLDDDGHLIEITPDGRRRRL